MRPPSLGTRSLRKASATTKRLTSKPIRNASCRLWCEGSNDDGIGESVTLGVKRPLPLYGILIRPGYYEYGT